FEAQADDGIDFQSAARWEIASGECSGCEQQSNADEDCWIARIHSIKKGAGHSGRAESGEQTENQTDRSEQHPLAQNQLKDLTTLRAQSHANPKLARPLTYRIGHHAINADRGENKCEQSQATEQNRAHPRGPKSEGEMLGNRVFVGDRNVIIDVPNDAMNFGQRRTGGAGGMGKNSDPAVW